MDKIAFLFAGQGSQYIGMGADFFTGHSGGIYDVMRSGLEEDLNKTINAQPAVYLHDLAVAEALRKRGIVPSCVAGFSLGEIPALVFAGVMNSKDGLSVVNIRAKAMQEACDKHKGAMVAVMRLGVDVIMEIAGQFKDVWLANFNSPDQVVCACSIESADVFSDAVIKQGGRAIKLKVSGAFHCPYMNDASEKFLKALYEVNFNGCSIPLYSNFTAKLYDAADTKELASKQINNPVLWQQIIENMLLYGVTTFVEVGPGKVLSGLVKKIADNKGILNAKILSASDMESVLKIVEELK